MNRIFRSIAFVVPGFFAVSCSSLSMAEKKPAAPVMPPVEASPYPGYEKTDRSYQGVASFYSIRCNGGTQTASGEKLSDYAKTAAHKTLPMGTRVLVTNKKNGKSVVVRINDRGPYIKGRIIDVTKGVAEELGMVSSGIVPCEVVVLQKKPEEPPAATGETSGSKKELKS